MSLKIAVRGASERNNGMVSLLRAGGNNVVYYVDANVQVCGKCIEGLPVISVVKALNLYANGEIDKFFVSPYLNSVATIQRELYKLGVNFNDICTPSMARISSGEPIHTSEVSSGNFVVTEDEIRHTTFLSWSNLDFNSVRDVLMNKGIDVLYLANIQDPGMMEFYRKYVPGIAVKLLDTTNKQEILSASGCAVGYYQDIFPDIVNKISMLELHRAANKECVSQTVDIEVVEDVWACLPVDYRGWKRRIELFDQGFTVILLEDADGYFAGAEYDWGFYNLFFYGKGEQWNNVFIRDSEDEAELKSDAAEIFVERQNIHQVPVLSSGRITKVVSRQAKPLPMVRWQMIDDTVAREFFSNISRVLISSEYGDLAGFREKFNWLDITVFDDNQMEAYISGEFDLLVFGAYVWPKSMTPQYMARQLFLDLLAETTVRWAKSQGVEIYNVDWAFKSQNLDYHISGHSNYPHIPWRLQVKDGHYIRGDESSEKINFVDGFRFTTDTPEQYKNTIYLYGPCMANGIFAYDDKDTMGSCMQRALNDMNLPYRVVMAGGGTVPFWFYQDINNLYRFFHTPLRSGDIAIFFMLDAWNHVVPFPLDPAHHCHLAHAFSNCLGDKEAYFVDKSIPQHMNPAGYDKSGQYILSILLPKLRAKMLEPNKGKTVIPFDYDKGLVDIVPLGLKEYLTNIQNAYKMQPAGSTIGCIVMNANPFTLGHKYLVTEAASRVDFLYVFIVEEDRSYFSFADRFAIANACCQGFANVAVLPSGKFMISSHTFAEYFEKENLQDEVVLPVKDVDLFARHIAPALKITCRFVGEEPLDEVTRQYNELMKSKLPMYGVKVVEIPRCKLAGDIISATVVRTLWKKGDMEQVSRYLPQQSYQYLMSHKVICRE